MSFRAHNIFVCVGVSRAIAFFFASMYLYIQFFVTTVNLFDRNARMGAHLIMNVVPYTVHVQSIECASNTAPFDEGSNV